MPSSSDAEPRSAKLQASYQKLSTAANALNTASDKLGEAVRALDEALTKLNPGVEAWVMVSQWADPDFDWQITIERLGFAKINNRWGLSLVVVEHDEQAQEEQTSDRWLFNDAPRELRIRAIEHVPALVEALANEATRTAEKVNVKANAAMELAASIINVAVQGDGKAGKR